MELILLRNQSLLHELAHTQTTETNLAMNLKRPWWPLKCYFTIYCQKKI